MVEPLTPTRRQIAKMADNDPQMIRAIEKLFRVVGVDQADDNSELLDLIDGLQLGASGNDDTALERFNFSTRGFRNGGLQFISDKGDFPAPVNNVITLQDGVTYWILREIDLEGCRLDANGTIAIRGGSSQICSITSTGLSDPLLTSNYGVLLRDISLDAEILFDLDGSGSGTLALDWRNVILTASNYVGTIANYANFVGQIVGLVESVGLTFDGTWGTISFDTSLATNSSGVGTSIILADTLVVTRRFRMVETAFDLQPVGVGIEFGAGTTVPEESFILSGVRFSGGGTYLSGIDETSPYAFFVDCIGIENTRNYAAYYMNNNATPTVIAVTNTPVKIAGITTDAPFSQGFTSTDNRETYTRIVPRVFKISYSATFTTGTNNVVSFYAAQNGTVQIASRASGTASSGGRGEGVFGQGLFELNQNDYLEIWVENNTATTNIIVEDLSVSIEEV